MSNEIRARILNDIRKLHGNDGSDVCAECLVKFPCNTVLLLNGEQA